MNTYDVAISGLGPTGLTLAHLLGRRGLSVLVLEREPEFYGNARAVYTDDEALRVFQTAGVADDIHTDMNVDSAVQWLKANGDVLIRFRQRQRPLWWPVVNFLYQPYLESRLESLLERYPSVKVLRGREVVDFIQDDMGVSVVHAASTGSGYGKRENIVDESSQRTVRAAYLVGADGGRSIVRVNQGIEMAGKSYPERWLVIDLAAKEGIDAFRHLPYFDFICDPDMPTVSCPQPGGRHRFEFALKDEDDRNTFASDEMVRKLMSAYVNPDEVEVKRQLVYTFNAVVADKWRNGRVLLAGDAAHMTPQFVGQGMNAGVRDADNLSWKLAAVIQHGADPKLLDTYESERRPHATSMIKFSVFNKCLVSIKNPVSAKARDAAMWTSLHTPGLRGWVRSAGMKPKPRLKKDGYVGLPRGLRGIEGTLAPQPEVRRYDGRPVRLDDALGTGWSVIGVGVDPRQTLGTDVAIWETVGTTFATIYAAGTRPQGEIGDGRRKAGLVDLEDTTNELTRWLRKAGVRRCSLVVLRPDKYVFGVARSGDATALTRALIAQLGLAAPAATPALETEMSTR
ncbi:3-(3-hydroxy-phenyl)propionate hydroxylase [Arthrobacter sp. GAS37]|uniref:bifunctional 3-(3-hydroxy-phenyl)propionate/3-hydroxycinnamic acid hydroxylase MhpA n=1 Tax=Arthrobacter sp. GAS37 TaxID=3156261 RepID=UPI0038382199